MPEKEQFLKAWEHEFATTVNVLKALPEEKQELRPHPKSKTARELAWVFASEESVFFDGVAAGEIEWNKMRTAPETIREAIMTFEHAHHDAVKRFKAIPDADLSKTMKFFTAPKTMSDVRRFDVLWMMLMDQIHHRGQFTIYLRLADAKVPSIYGPTADEPWN